MHAVSPSHLPALLVFLENNPTAISREGWRMSLLGRWAESDAAAAMAYAYTVGGKYERELAILAVLQWWGDSDAEGAAAWAKPLPPGQLRRHAAAARLGCAAAF